MKKQLVICRSLALLLGFALALPTPVLALRAMNAGMEEGSPIALELSKAMQQKTATGLETLALPWNEVVGENGVSDLKRFNVPENILKVIEDPEAIFSQRFLLLLEHLKTVGGWSDRHFSSVSGISRSTLSSWRQASPPVPMTPLEQKASDAIMVSPYLLLTGQPKEEARQVPASIRERIHLLRKVEGKTLDGLADGRGLETRSSLSWIDEDRPIRRFTIYETAQLFSDADVAYLETGFSPDGAELLIQTSWGDLGSRRRPQFPSKVQTKNPLWAVAGLLEDAIIAHWPGSTEGLRKQIEMDENNNYPGVAATLLLYKPGAFERTAYYGLFTESVARWFSESQKTSVWVNRSETESFVQQLAVAHEELERLFESEARNRDGKSMLRPGRGYRKRGPSRIQNIFHLLANLWNRERILIALNNTPAGYSPLKSMLFPSDDPEGKIWKTKKLHKSIHQESLNVSSPFHGISIKTLERYVWDNANPRQALTEGIELRDGLSGFVEHGWLWGEGGKLINRTTNKEAVLREFMFQGPGIMEKRRDLIKHRRAAFELALLDGTVPLFTEQVEKLPLTMLRTGLLSNPEQSKALDFAMQLAAAHSVRDGGYKQEKFLEDAPNPTEVALAGRRSYTKATDFMNQVGRTLQSQDRTASATAVQDQKQHMEFVEDVVAQIQFSGLEESRFQDEDRGKQLAERTFLLATIFRELDIGSRTAGGMVSFDRDLQGFFDDPKDEKVIKALAQTDLTSEQTLALLEADALSLPSLSRKAEARLAMLHLWLPMPFEKFYKAGNLSFNAEDILRDIEIHAEERGEGAPETTAIWETELDREERLAFIGQVKLLIEAPTTTALEENSAFVKLKRASISKDMLRQQLEEMASVGLGQTHVVIVDPANDPLLIVFSGLEENIHHYYPTRENAVDIAHRLVLSGAIGFHLVGDLAQSDPLFNLTNYAGLETASIQRITGTVKAVIEQTLASFGASGETLSAYLPAFMAGLEALATKA